MIAGSEYKDRSRGSAGLHSQPFIRSMLVDARTRKLLCDLEQPDCPCPPDTD
jgi:hypothetical protein